MAKKKGGKDKAEVKEVKAPLKPNGMTEDEFVLYNDVNELVVQLRGGGSAEPLVSRVRAAPLAHPCTRMAHGAQTSLES